MAARFWVTGGTGNWNSTTNWSATTGGASGASVPSTSDTATFNALSGSSTVTLDISPTVQTLTMTGFTGTLDFGTNTISLNSTGTIFTGATTMTVTGTPQIICTNSSATARTITPGVVTEANSISFRITAGTGTVSLTAGAYLNLDFTDGTNPTGYAGALGNTAITIYGSFKASTGMTRTAGATTYTFAATSGTKTIDTAGVTFDNAFTFNGVGGTFQLASALTSGATRTATLTNGTLDLNGYTLTTGLFNSSNSNTRAIAFGTGKIVLTATSGTIFTTSTATGLTVTGTNPLIQATAGGAGTRSITIGAAGESNAISVDVTTGSDIISIGATSGAYKNVNFTGFTGTVSLGNSILVFGNWNYGGTTTQGVGGGTVTFSATSGTKTITSNGFSFPGNVTFNGIGGTFACQDALTLGSTRALTLTNGTLTTNGYAVTAGIFSSNNSNVRALNLGASPVTLTSTGTVWNITDPTNMTLNAGTSTITTSGNTATITFAGGSLTYYNVTFGETYYNTTMSGANTFNNLTLASPAAAGRRSLTFTANQTINGTLTCSGSAANSRPRLVGGVGGNTLTAASVSLADADFNAIIAAGASSPWSGTRLGNFGGNTNITFTAPKTVYWNQPAGGNWSDVAWATASGGAVNINNFPLGQDTAILDNTGVGASSTIVMNYGWVLPSISAGSLTNALTINWNTFSTLTAGIAGATTTLSSAINFTLTGGSLAFNPLSNGTVTTAGVSFPMLVALAGSPGITLTLSDDFTCTGKINVVTGTVNLNGKTLTGDNFDGTFGDLEVRAIAFNGGQINVTGNAATVWAWEDLTNFSYTGTPTVNFTYSGSTGTRTINNGATGATESNVVDFNVTAGTDQWTATANNSVRNLNFTGFSGTTGLFGAGFIYGNLTLSPTQTITSSSSATTFAATSGTKTITTNGVVIDRQLLFNGIGGTWALQDALTLGATNGGIRQWAGTFTTNNYSITCTDYKAQASTAVGNRSINLGSSVITLLGSATSNASWQTEDGAYTLTINAGTSTIYMAEAYTGTSLQLFYGGGKTYYNVVYSGGQPGGFYQGGTFNSISNSIQPLALSFEAGTTVTVNNFGFSGTAGNLVTMTSSVPGTQWNLAKNTGGKVLVSYVSITDSAAAPAGYWFAPTSQGNVDGGNNTGWNFGAAGGVVGFLPFF